VVGCEAVEAIIALLLGISGIAEMLSIVGAAEAEGVLSSWVNVRFSY
jgi:hypothetical protein